MKNLRIALLLGTVIGLSFLAPKAFANAKEFVSADGRCKLVVSNVTDFENTPFIRFGVAVYKNGYVDKSTYIGIPESIVPLKEGVNQKYSYVPRDNWSFGGDARAKYANGILEIKIKFTGDMLSDTHYRTVQIEIDPELTVLKRISTNDYRLFPGTGSEIDCKF